MSKSKRDRKPRRQDKHRKSRHRSTRTAVATACDGAIVRAYVPLEDAWQASGFGAAGVARQQPNGTIAYALFNFSLMDRGVSSMLGKPDATLEELEELITNVKDLMPRAVPGSIEVVSRFVWGAYGFGLENGYEWPDDDVQQYLKLVPPLSGTRRWWSQQFVQMASPRLSEVIAGLPDDGDVPSNQELAVFGTARFDLDAHEEAAAKLDARRPEFECVGKEKGRLYFEYSREYPRNHWSPLRLLGGRQSMGTVTIEHGSLTAETRTLSVMSSLVAKLKDSMGEGMRFRSGEWIDPMASLRHDDAEDEGFALLG